MEEKSTEKTVRYKTGYLLDRSEEKSFMDTQKLIQTESGDVLAEMEAALQDIADENPRIESEDSQNLKTFEDMRAILEVSLAINSSLVLDDILRIVMQKAIELLSAERGFIMLLDDRSELKVKIAHNIQNEQMSEEDFKISSSIANKAASSGKSIYTSDAQSDERYSNLKSVLELHLRSIMCVPLKIKKNVIGVIYLDNSSQAKLFLKSDLFLFELLAQQAAHAIYNATLYDHLLDLKVFNEKVVNNSPVGIAVIDTGYNMVSINDAALQALEKNRNDVQLLAPNTTPTRFLDLVPPSETTRWRQMLDIALTTNQPFEDGRYFYNTEYNEKVLSVKITPINKLPYGGDGLILIIEDITEKVIMEKYVILSEKLVARGEMASSIGHELNNYLAIVSNNAELLGLNLKKKQYDKAEFNSQQIVENISKMKRFTDGLMDFSKLETEIVPYDVRNLIEELLFTLKSQARFKRITFSVDLDSDLPKINIDVGQIQQVLMNLLNNAADAIEEKVSSETAKGNNSYRGKIIIKANLDISSSKVRIQVTDNGAGIPEDSQAKVFQPHFTTKDSGHGLGLANCRKIIKNHKGEIELSSSPEEGTTFTIALPLGENENAV